MAGLHQVAVRSEPHQRHECADQHVFRPRPAAGSEIMVPSYTFFATCLAMRFFGCVPIFVDIDPKTACFDLEDAKRKLTPRNRARRGHAFGGHALRNGSHRGVAKEKGLILLEDAAHAHGASMQGRKLGTWGAMASSAFKPARSCRRSKAGWACIRPGSISSAPPDSATTSCRASSRRTARFGHTMARASARNTACIRWRPLWRGNS